MRKFGITVLGMALVYAISIEAIDASTIASFDPGDPGTPGTLMQYGDAPGPDVPATGGNPGGFLRLTQAVNGQNNFGFKDLTDPGIYGGSAFDLDFKIMPDATPSADGFSFFYADTATYGTTGAPGSAPFTPEDPAAEGVLGFGFDTWSNQGDFDNPDVPTGSDYQEISVFYDGTLIARIDDTRLLGTPLTLDDGQWHNVTGFVNFSGGTVDLNVDSIPIFTDLAVPGLAPFESRIGFAARTGGENELAGIDNVNVGWIAPIPEPTTYALAVFGFGAFLLSVRRRGHK